MNATGLDWLRSSKNSKENCSSKSNALSKVQIIETAILNLPLSYFHFRINRMSFSIEICSCSSSDRTSIVNIDTITDENSGSHCSPRSFCIDNKRFESSNIGSLPPACQRRQVDKVISRNSTTDSWASKISC